MTHQVHIFPEGGAVVHKVRPASYGYGGVYSVWLNARGDYLRAERRDGKNPRAVARTAGRLKIALRDCARIAVQVKLADDEHNGRA